MQLIKDKNALLPRLAPDFGHLGLQVVRMLHQSRELAGLSVSGTALLRARNFRRRMRYALDILRIFGVGRPTSRLKRLLQGQSRHVTCARGGKKAQQAVDDVIARGWCVSLQESSCIVSMNTISASAAH